MYYTIIIIIYIYVCSEIHMKACWQKEKGLLFIIISVISKSLPDIEQKIFNKFRK